MSKIALSEKPPTLTGVVVGDKMDKTVVVRIDRRVQHPLYGKIITRSSKLKAHDETNQAAVGDVVTVVKSRPISKSKFWRLVSVNESAGG